MSSTLAGAVADVSRVHRVHCRLEAVPASSPSLASAPLSRLRIRHRHSRVGFSNHYHGNSHKTVTSAARSGEVDELGSRLREIEGDEADRKDALPKIVKDVDALKAELAALEEKRQAAVEAERSAQEKLKTINAAITRAKLAGKGGPFSATLVAAASPLQDAALGLADATGILGRGVKAASSASLAGVSSLAQKVPSSVVDALGVVGAVLLAGAIAQQQGFLPGLSKPGVATGAVAGAAAAVPKVDLGLVSGSMLSWMKTEPKLAGPMLPGEVMELKADDFDASIKRMPHVFVEFYAPWCPFCKSLTPAWNELATILKDQGSKMQLARLDADAYVEIADRYEVPGFPTLMHFRNGTPLAVHKGPRDVATLLAFVNRQLPT
eukprot:jgi/Mesvir1/207/Mv13551-RA.1